MGTGWASGMDGTCVPKSRAGCGARRDRGGQRQRAGSGSGPERGEPAIVRSDGYGLTREEREAVWRALCIGYDVSGASRSMRRIGPVPQTGQRRMSIPVSCRMRSAADAVVAGAAGGVSPSSRVPDDVDAGNASTPRGT